MSMPETRHEMKRAMYTHTGDSKCKSCGAAIEWWLTSRNKKKIPVDILPGQDEHSVVRAHFASCPHADQHRKPKPAAPAGALGPEAMAVAAESGRAGQPARLQWLMQQVRFHTGARVVVAVYAEHTVFAYDLALPAEDLRQELISAANQVRTHITRGNA